MLSSSEQCCVYLELLRETIWPKGKLASDEEEVLSDAEKAERKAQAKKVLKEFFPGIKRTQRKHLEVQTTFYTFGVSIFNKYTGPNVAVFMSKWRINPGCV